MQKLFRRKKNPLLDGVNPKPVTAAQPRSRPARLRVPGSRGWGGRGGGAAALVPAVREYRGTTVQVCGLWPFSLGYVLAHGRRPAGPARGNPGHGLL